MDMIADQFRLLGRSAVGAFVLLASSAGMAAAQTGSLNGRVTARGSNFPVPQAEQNNPNLPAGQSCIDRNA